MLVTEAEPVDGGCRGYAEGILQQGYRFKLWNFPQAFPGGPADIYMCVMESWRINITQNFQRISDAGSELALLPRDPFTLVLQSNGGFMKVGLNRE